MDKIKKTRLGPYLADYTRERREIIAAELLNPERIRTLCGEAATLGEAECEIKQPLPVNLRATQAARIAEDWLRREGLDFEWNLRRDAVAGADYPVLLVRWRI